MGVHEREFSNAKRSEHDPTFNVEISSILYFPNC